MLKVLNKIIDSVAKEKMIIFILASVQFLHILDFVVLMPIGPMLMEQLSMTPAQFGSLVSSYNFSAGIIGIFFGLIADRFERKKLLIWCFIFFGIATILCGIAPNMQILFMARLLSGAFGGILNTIVFIIVTDLIPVERRGRAMGIILASFSITSIVGIPIGLIIAESFSWRHTFILIGVISLLVVLLAKMVLPIIPVTNTNINLRANFRRLFSIATNKNYISSYLLISTMAFSGFLLFPYLSPYVVKNMGLPETDLKYIYLVGGIFTVFATKFIGQLSDRFDEAKVFLPLALLSIPLVYLYTTVTSISLTVLLCISTPFMIVFSGRIVPVMTLISKIPKQEERGTFMGIFHSLRSLAGALASLIAGLMMSETSDGKLMYFDRTGYLAILFILFGIYITFTISKKVKENEK